MSVCIMCAMLREKIISFFFIIIIQLIRSGRAFIRLCTWMYRAILTTLRGDAMKLKSIFSYLRVLFCTYTATVCTPSTDSYILYISFCFCLGNRQTLSEGDTRESYVRIYVVCVIDGTTVLHTKSKRVYNIV